MRRSLVILVLVLLALPASVALAKRKATRAESNAIYKALPKSQRITPQKCFTFRISTANRTWGYAQITHFTSTGACRYRGIQESPGRFYVHQTRKKWRVVVSGTGFTCSDFRHVKMPRKVIKDLDGRNC